MTPNRPYLLRAFYNWILDNEHTPYLVVEADLPHVQVPPQSIKDGQVVLNISPTAVQALQIDNEQLSFSARFGGVPFQVYVPMYAVSAIYSRENGAGTMFPPEDYDIDSMASDMDLAEENEPRKGANFEVVSSTDGATKEPVSSSSETEGLASTSDVEDSESKKKKGSHLSVVK